MFDRLFGTYVAERDEERCCYGRVKPINSYNILQIELHVWTAMARDVMSARTAPARPPRTCAAEAATMRQPSSMRTQVWL